MCYSAGPWRPTAAVPTYCMLKRSIIKSTLAEVSTLGRLDPVSNFLQPKLNFMRTRRALGFISQFLKSLSLGHNYNFVFDFTGDDLWVSQDTLGRGDGQVVYSDDPSLNPTETCCVKRTITNKKRPILSHFLIKKLRYPTTLSCSVTRLCLAV